MNPRVMIRSKLSSLKEPTYNQEHIIPKLKEPSHLPVPCTHMVKALRVCPLVMTYRGQVFIDVPNPRDQIFANLIPLIPWKC